MTRSKELYDKWKGNGGDLSQYRQQYHSDIKGPRNSHTKWHPSFVYRYRPSPRPKRTDADPVEESDIREAYHPPSQTTTCENCNQIQNTGTNEYSHLLWKHNGTDTWMHVKSGNSIIVGEEIGFKAYVTIEGQHLTIGEYHVSPDPHEVFEWAREWMEDNIDVSHLYDD